MKPFSAALAIVLTGLAGPALAQAQAQAGVSLASLQLTPGKVFTDAAGAYVSVAVKNSGTQTVSEARVACEFFQGRRSLGKSATTLFSIVGGITGTDQVRLLGATRADRADCAITEAK